MKYAVSSVEISSGGSGHANDCVVVFSDGINGNTAEGQPVFEDGVLTSISITHPGEYSSAPSISIHGRRTTPAIASPVLSGYVDSFAMTDGGAYTGRSVSVSFSGGDPADHAVVSGTPTFDTKILSVTVVDGGAGYTSKASKPLRAKMGSAVLGNAILSPCSVDSIDPPEESAWINGTGTIQPFQMMIDHPWNGYWPMTFRGTQGTPPVPSVSIVSFGIEPVPLSVSYSGTVIQGVHSLVWTASLLQGASGIRGPFAIKIDFPEIETTRTLGSNETSPSSSANPQMNGGLFNVDYLRWYANDPLEPFSTYGLTSIVDESNIVSVVQTGFSVEQTSALSMAPPGANIWEGRGNSTEYIGKVEITFPPVSQILAPAVVLSDDFPQSYPTPSVIVAGDDDGDPCVISANFSNGRCFYSIAAQGGGYRTEPSVTVTNLQLTPSPVHGGHQWSQVAVKPGHSSGLASGGVPMWWPIYGHYDPQRVGFSIAITRENGDGGGARGRGTSVFRKEPITKHSTPGDVGNLLPQTPGNLFYNPTTPWGGPWGLGSVEFWLGQAVSTVRTHYGVPRLIYRMNGNETLLVDGQPSGAAWSAVVPLAAAPSGWFESLAYTYWHSPSFPAYSSEYLFEKEINDADATLRPATGVTASAFGYGACFIEPPQLSGGLTASLKSPGPCAEIFYGAEGALYVTSTSGEVWILDSSQGGGAGLAFTPTSSSRRAAPAIGIDTPLRRETIKFHETKFSVKWSWGLEEKTQKVKIGIGCAGGQGEDCHSETLNYKVLSPPEKEATSESCGWGNAVSVILDGNFFIRITNPGSGYCAEDFSATGGTDFANRPYFRLTGGRALVGVNEVFGSATVQVTNQNYQVDRIQFNASATCGGYYTADQPFVYPGGVIPDEIPLVLCNQPPGCNSATDCDNITTQVTQVSRTAIKSVEWNNVHHRFEPTLVDLPEVRAYPNGVEVLDGQVVGFSGGLFNIGFFYGAVQLASLYGGGIIGFTELPSIEFVSPQSAGSGMTVAITPASSAFSSPRPTSTYKAASGAAYLREDGRPTSPGILSVNIYGVPFLSRNRGDLPMPETYGEDFSDIEGGLSLSGSGKAYRFRDGRPWPEPNLEVTINSPGSGYSLLPRIEVSQPSQKIATANIGFNGRLVSLGVDDGGFGYTFPPSLSIDGDGTGECVISGPVSAVDVTDGGSGYSHPPKVLFTGAGWPGKATCSLNEDGSVGSVFVQDGGEYRSAPGVAFDPVPEVTSVSISAGGSGYTSNPRVDIVGNCGGSGATATAKINGQVVEIEVASGGSGYSSESPPQVTFSGGGGGGASATVTIDDETGEVTGFVISSGGSWYTSRPSVTLSGGAGSGASGVAKISGPVATLTLGAGGKGYLEPPSVLFVGGGGSDASADASVGTRGGGAAATSRINGSIIYAYVTSQGSGYDQSPNVQISGGGNIEIDRLSSLLSSGGISSGEYERMAAAARGKIQARVEGKVTSVEITNAGSGYVHPSQVTDYGYGGYRKDSVWAPLADARGAGYGGTAAVGLTAEVPSCLGGGVSVTSLPTKTYFQKPVFLDTGIGVAVRVESVRGSRSTSRGLRARRSFTKTLEGTITDGVSEELEQHLLRCKFTNVSGKRVRDLQTTPVVYDNITELFMNGSGLAFRLSQLRFSEESPPQFELFDKTGTGAVLQASLDGSGSINSIIFSSDGSSYTDDHRLQITGGRIRFIQCQATCVVSDQGEVTSITVNSPGDGYLSPTVVVHGGGGSGCFASAVLQSGALPRGVRAIAVEFGGSGYSQESPPSVFIADASPPFAETQFAKLINSRLLRSRATAWTEMEAEYAHNEGLPAFVRSTDYNFESLVGPIFETVSDWGPNPTAIVDNFATFENVETTAVDWGTKVPEPYSGAVQVEISGACEEPLSLTAVGVSWTKVFGKNDPAGSSGWGAAAIKT
jgi:hypothetical protein